MTAEITKLLSAEVKRRKRNQAIRKAIVGTLTNWIGCLYSGWMLMLAVGVAHAEWIRVLPTIGYWWAVLLVLLLRGVFSVPKGVK